MPGTAVTIFLGEPELAVLDRSIRGTTPALTREQALAGIVAAWAAAQLVTDRPGPVHQETDEGMRPSELNASNDL